MSNVATNRTVAACIANGTTNIPLRRTFSKPGVMCTSPTNKYVVPLSEDAVKWKKKYEESEKKRIEQISHNERALRSNNGLERKNNNLQTKLEEMETELFEKNESLTKLTTASKNLFKEYDTLKNRYEAETGAMHRALTDASQWYRENRALKRRTLMLPDNADTVDEGVEEGDSNTDSELENLRESVKQLSEEVALLQTELSAAKLQEFEATEANVNLHQDFDTEKRKVEQLEAELKELRESHEQVLRISNIMKRELEELGKLEKNQKDSMVTLKKEADDYKRERNVLAHQSTILLHNLNSDDGPEKLFLLQEIEDLKRAVEEERNAHNIEVNNLQEKLEELERNSHTEILEERLKLVESELQCALERAEDAEQLLQIPPPPPPPPLPPPLPPTAPARVKKLARSSVPDIAESLGMSPVENDLNKKTSPTGVNDDIINQIKDGKFTLRKSKKEGCKKERETPKAVSEMLNILGSLRRAPKNRISVSSSFADVQL